MIELQHQDGWAGPDQIAAAQHHEIVARVAAEGEAVAGLDPVIEALARRRVDVEAGGLGAGPRTCGQFDADEEFSVGH